MEYEPQTESEEALDKRLKTFDQEFDAIAASMDIITVSTEKLLNTLDKRLTTLMECLENEPPRTRLTDA